MQIRFFVKREKKILDRCIQSHTWWSMTNDLPQQNPPIDPIAFSKLAHIISTSSTCKQISIRTCMSEWSRAWSRTNLEPNGYFISPNEAVTFREPQIVWSKNWHNFFISHEFQSGLRSHMNLHTRQVQHFHQAYKFSNELDKKYGNARCIKWWRLKIQYCTLISAK